VTWTAGCGPRETLVAIGTAGFLAARTSQEAIARFRPVFEARLARASASAVAATVAPVCASGATAWSRGGLLEIAPLDQGARLRTLAEVLGGSRQFGPGVLHQQWTALGLPKTRARMGASPRRIARRAETA
jgi:hypothetical protein